MDQEKNREIFALIIATIEKEFANFYGFDLVAKAEDHLLSHTEFLNIKKNQNGFKDLSPRGNVLAIHPANGEDELFIGIQLHADIFEKLTRQDPLVQLDDKNLDAYCVLVEELSHFHLLINRAHSDRSVSNLELEYQGELDKVLSCAFRLRAQRNDPHYLPLARKIFDLCSFTKDNQKWGVYRQATKFAARLWYEILSYQDGIDEPMSSMNLKKILRPIYHGDWLQKYQLLKNVKAA